MLKSSGVSGLILLRHEEKEAQRLRSPSQYHTAGFGGTWSRAAGASHTRTPDLSTAPREKSGSDQRVKNESWKKVRDGGPKEERKGRHGGIREKKKVVKNERKSFRGRKNRERKRRFPEGREARRVRKESTETQKGDRHPEKDRDLGRYGEPERRTEAQSERRRQSRCSPPLLTPHTRHTHTGGAGRRRSRSAHGVFIKAARRGLRARPAPAACACTSSASGGARGRPAAARAPGTPRRPPARGSAASTAAPAGWPDPPRPGPGCGGCGRPRDAVTARPGPPPAAACPPRRLTRSPVTAPSVERLGLCPPSLSFSAGVSVSRFTRFGAP